MELHLELTAMEEWLGNYMCMTKHILTKCVHACFNPFVHGPRNCQNMQLSLKWNIFIFIPIKSPFDNILIFLLVSEIKPIFQNYSFISRASCTGEYMLLKSIVMDSPDFSPSASFWNPSIFNKVIAILSFQKFPKIRAFWKNCYPL